MIKPELPFLPLLLATDHDVKANEDLPTSTWFGEILRILWRNTKHMMIWCWSSSLLYCIKNIFSFLPLLQIWIIDQHQNISPAANVTVAATYRSCNCKKNIKKEKFSSGKTNSLLGLVLSDGNIDKPIPEEGQTILVVIINISSYTFNAVLTNWDGTYQCHHHK